MSGGSSQSSGNSSPLRLPGALSGAAHGQLFNGFLAVKESFVRATRNNKPFLNASLTDGSSTIRAKMWEYSGGAFQVGTVVKVIGRFEEFQGKVDLVITGIRPAAEDECDPSVFLPVHPDREALWERLLELVGGVRDAPLRGFLECVFSDEALAKRFKEAPGGKHHHHSCVGGLLCHSVSVAETCLRLAEGRAVDVDVLVAGALLHDIGKVDAYACSGAVFEMTDSGRLLGHIALGLMLLSRLLDFFPGRLGESRRNELLHMVLSHHGSMEKGSPVEPATLEAEILHYADELDFKADRILRAVGEAAEGSRWTARIGVLGNRQYYIRPRWPWGPGSGQDDSSGFEGEGWPGEMPDELPAVDGEEGQPW